MMVPEYLTEGFGAGNVHSKRMQTCYGISGKYYEGCLGGHVGCVEPDQYFAPRLTRKQV